MEVTARAVPRRAIRQRCLRRGIERIAKKVGRRAVETDIDEVSHCSVGAITAEQGKALMEKRPDLSVTLWVCYWRAVSIIPKSEKSC